MLDNQAEFIKRRFFGFFEGADWSNIGLILLFLENGAINPIVMLTCIVIAVSSIAECAQDAYKTIKKSMKTTSKMERGSGYTKFLLKGMSLVKGKAV